MAQRPARSLKHEYELYVEEEIENYKESIPRSVLLGIGDSAVAALTKQPQFALTELLLTEEVDRIIFTRLRLPTYQTWRRRRLKLIAEMRRPEHWGFHPDDALVRAVRPSGEAHVLVAGATAEAPALYLAANGCDVTAITEELDALRRVMSAAAEAGLGERVHACHADLTTWIPDAELQAVIVMAAALKGLSVGERARVIEALQGATAFGGVHVVQTSAGSRAAPSVNELASRYAGWTVSVERAQDENTNTFLARKEVA
jgi:hypothetical protein